MVRGAAIGSAGPCGRILVQVELGWEIIPELAPWANKIVIDKPARSATVVKSLEVCAI